MRDVDYEDRLADFVRSIIAPVAPRAELDYGDFWAGEDE